MNLRIARFAVGLVVAGTACLANAQMVDKGLVGYWPLDEANVAGKEAKDVIGKNHGTFLGGPKMVAGKVGKALEFNGAEAIEIPGTDSLNFAGKKELTAMVWVNAKNNSPVVGVVAGCCGLIFGQRDSEGFALRFDGRNAGQEMEFIVHSGGWDGDGGFGAPTFKEGEWHHMTGVVSGTKMFLYVDGAFLKEGVVGGAIVSKSSETEIGKAGDGGFIGSIDEVAVYDRALTADEIKMNYTAKGLAVTPGGKLATSWATLKVR